MSQVFVLHPSQNISGYFLPYKYSNLTFSKQRLVFSILKETGRSRIYSLAAEANNYVNVG